jgi:hypothetical protein
MDYGEAIEVLQRSSEKFEFPVKWIFYREAPAAADKLLILLGRV